jgi:hypothetical protein
MARHLLHRGLFAWLALSLAVLSAPAVRGDQVEVKPGKVALPLSGLEIELPKDPRKDFTWQLTASFSEKDGGYDGRDVIDEKIGNRLQAGTWVHLGYFTAGDCRKTVATADLADDWTAEVELAGLKMAARGGIFTFDDKDIGKVPAVVLCGHREGHKDLLLYHFYVADPAIGREAILAGLPNVAAVERTVRSWLADRWVPVVPLRRPEVRRRGEPPKRTVRLEKSSMDLTLPDDGYVWLHRKPAKEDAVDWLERLAPALPEVEIELVRVPGTTCASVLDGITTARSTAPGPEYLPRDWVAGPTLLVNGSAERTVCRQAGTDALVVGVFAVPDKGPSATDFAPLGPLLNAISAAAGAPRP